MAVTVSEYTQFKDMILSGLDWDTDVLKVALFDGTHTFAAADTSYNSLSNECVGAGYTAGGIVVPGVTKSGGIITASSASWGDLTIGVRYVVLYTTKTIDTIANPLLLFYDLGSLITLSTIPWSFSWTDNKIISLV